MPHIITCYHCQQEGTQSVNNFAYCVDCERTIRDRLRAGSLVREQFALARQQAMSNLRAFLDSAPEIIYQIQTLQFENTPILEMDLLRLAGSPRLAQLRILHLKKCSISPNAISALAASTHLRSLISLCLAENPLGPDGIRALCRNSVLSRLKELDLSKTRITDELIENLIRSPMTEQLETLRLDGNQIGDTGAGILANADFLDNLTTLSLTSNQIGDPGVEALARSCNFPKLKTLFLTSILCSEESLRLFADPACIKSLTELHLGPDPIDLHLWQELIGRFGGGLHAIPHKRSHAPFEAVHSPTRIRAGESYRIPTQEIQKLFKR